MSVFTTALADLTLPIVEDHVMRQRQYQSFLEKAGIVGKGSSFPVMLKNSPESEPGDEVRFPIVANLKGPMTLSNAGTTTGPFTTAVTKLQGREESIIFSKSSATMIVERCAVKVDGETTLKKMVVRIWDHAAPLLKRRVSDAEDAAFFSAIAGPTEYDVTTNGVVFAPNAVCVVGSESPTWDGVGAEQKMSVERIQELCYLADLRRIEMVELPGIGPVRGVLIMTPGQANDLKKDPDFREALENAQPRSNDNPLFRGLWSSAGGGLINIDGVYLCVNRCTAGVKLNAAGTQEVVGASFLRQEVLNETRDKAEAIFLGAGAVGWARAYKFKMAEDSLNDYGDQPSLAGKRFGGYCKITFNDGDYTTEKVRDFATIYVPTTQPKVTV